MANLDIENALGIPDKRQGWGQTAGHVLSEINNMTTVGNLKTRLQALNAAYYTNARLESMTKNDLQYALRQATGDSAGIK